MQSIFDHRCFGKVNQNLVTTATARTINPNRWAFLLLPGFFCHAASSFAPLWLHRWKCEPLTSAFNKTPLGISTKTPGRCDKVRQQNLELFFLPGKPLVPQFLRQPSCWVLGVSSCLNKNWTQKITKGVPGANLDDERAISMIHYWGEDVWKRSIPMLMNQLPSGICWCVSVAPKGHEV